MSTISSLARSSISSRNRSGDTPPAPGCAHVRRTGSPRTWMRSARWFPAPRTLIPRRASTSGDVVHDSGVILAHQFDAVLLRAFGPGRLFRSLRDDLHAARLQRIQHVEKGSGPLFGHLGQQDPGKLPGQGHHAALGPVAVMGGQGVGQLLDNTRLVVGDHGQEQWKRLSSGTPSWVTDSIGNSRLPCEACTGRAAGPGVGSGQSGLI